MTLSTLIKFVGAGNGGTGGGAGSAASAGVATGDILMMIAGIVLAVAGVCAIVFARRYATATSGIHGQTSSKISAPIIAAVAVVLLGLTISIVGATHMKAHADTNDALQASGDVIATVDEQTGEVTFSNVDITNTGEKPQVIDEFQFAVVEGVTTIDDIEWTVKIGDTVVHEGTIGGSHEVANPVTIEAGSTAKLTVSATELSADLAKSLIGQDVANATSGYNVKSFKVDATVDDTSHGSIAYNPSGTALNVEYGTSYTVDNANSKITFGTGNEAQTITFSATSGYKLTEWQLNGQAAVSGTVISTLSFTAITEVAIQGKSLVSTNGVRYYPVFEDESLSEDFKFYSSEDGTTFTPIAASAASGKYKMTDLASYADKLYYTNSGSNSLTCVAATYEEFDDAFAAADGSAAAQTAEDNRAYKYKGSFADKNEEGVTCVALSDSWFSTNSDSAKYSSQGKYGPGKEFDFTTQISSNEPKVSGVGIGSVYETYDDFSQTSNFWSCVSKAGNPTGLAWCWAVWTQSWYNGMSRSVSGIGSVVFSRAFN